MKRARLPQVQAADASSTRSSPSHSQVGVVQGPPSKRAPTQGLLLQLNTERSQRGSTSGSHSWRLAQLQSPTGPANKVSLVCEHSNSQGLYSAVVCKRRPVLPRLGSQQYVDGTKFFRLRSVSAGLALCCCAAVQGRKRTRTDQEPEDDGYSSHAVVASSDGSCQAAKTPLVSARSASPFDKQSALQGCLTACA